MKKVLFTLLSLLVLTWMPTHGGERKIVKQISASDELISFAANPKDRKWRGRWIKHPQASLIYEYSKALGRVPIIDPNKRRGVEIELSPAEKVRYRERSTVEQGNSDLKDNYGARHVRVNGHEKVYTHLMFGVIAITVKQLFNMLN